MAANYETISYYKAAKKNYEKALKYAKTSDNSYLIAYIYNGLGNISSENNNLKSSVEYYQKSLKTGNKSHKYNPLSATLNLAWSYIDLGDYKTSYSYLISSEKMIAKTNDIYATSEISYLKGKYFLNEGKIDIALNYFDKAIDIAIEKNMLRLLLEIYKTRANLYESLGQYKKAHQELKTFQSFQDKLKLEQIETTKTNFSIDEYERSLNDAIKEKEYRINLAKNNKTINTITFAGITLMLGTIFFLLRAYRSKKRLTLSLKEKNEELLSAKSKAEKLTQIKSQFISTVSHELRTPLYGVIGITSLLIDDTEVLKKHKKLLESLKFSGDYLLNLINNVLKIGEIESQKIQLQNKPTNLKILCKNLLNSFNYQAKSNRNELILELDSKLPKLVLIDSLRLSEILINLIGNAIKYTENGKIWLRLRLISLKKEQAVITFEIEDNGIGIPKNKTDLVFEKFSQINRELDKLDGTGLGLSIVKNLLRIMGSQIFLDSTPEKGTKFTFTLNLAITNENNNTLTNSNDCTFSPNHKSILIVEDNKISQIVTQNILDKIGYTSIIAEDGAKAVEIVKKQDFDLILMDLNMPFLNGYEATRIIRKTNQTVPIIALTASELEEVEKNCLAAGMNDAINKPLSKKNLEDIIYKNISSDSLTK